MDKIYLDEYSDSRYVYHQTNEQSRREIEKRGFNPLSRKDLPQEQSLAQIAKQFDIEFPVDRAEATFFYPSIATLEEKQVYNYVIVVDLEELQDTYYLADLSLYDAFLDEQQDLDRSGDTATTLDRENVQNGLNYLHSIQAVQTLEDVQQALSSTQSGELIVETVPDSAIVGYDTF